MKSQVNIIAVVDVIGALSIKSLYDGNLCMVDDSPFDSTHQGTPNLVTVVKPGQVVSWTALAVDLQTPVEIKSISFTPAEGQQGHEGQQGQQSRLQQPGQQGPGTHSGPATVSAPPSAPGMGTAVPGPGPTDATGAGAGAQAHQPNQPNQPNQSYQSHQPHSSQESDGDKLDLDVWTGVVPHWMTPGVPYQYRLELQMYEGDNSVMTIDSPALMCQ
ncbi:hypothetical protein AB0H82_05045 [Streptomyces sp. NPDC050732]|uniref:hypothetical protein n=1 Tax=Streptomyces sp. NPDC050732 TaxID=3154632 RepID=UPI0034495359